jgi:hypothetical protein
VNNTSFAHQSGGSNKDNHTGAIPKPRFHVPCAVKSAGEGEHQPGSRSNGKFMINQPINQSINQSINHSINCGNQVFFANF